MPTSVDRMVATLRDEHRIKRDVDYALIMKYGQVRLLCAAVFLSSIRREATAAGVRFASVATYDCAARGAPIGEEPVCYARGRRLADRWAFDDGPTPDVAELTYPADDPDEVIVRLDRMAAPVVFLVFHAATASWMSPEDRDKRERA